MSTGGTESQDGVLVSFESVLVRSGLLNHISLTTPLHNCYSVFVVYTVMSSLAILTPQELDRLFKDTQATALHYLDQQDYSEALKHLNMNEGILEEVTAQDYKADPDFILVTLHNLACCHQGLEHVDSCASYLEACLYNLNNTQGSGKTHKPNWMRKKYECRTRMQLCAMLSQMERHEAGLIHAQTGMKLAQNLLKEIYSFCKNHLSRHHELATESPKMTHTFEYRRQHSLVKEAYPLLDFLENKLTSKQPGRSFQKLEARSALGVQQYSDWVYSLDIPLVMTIRPLTLFQVKNELDTYSELARDSLLDKVCLVITGMYCVATEIRMLYGEEDWEKMAKAQICHYKAMKLAKAVLPLESLLTEHLVISYQKHFAGMTTPQPNIKLNRSTRYPLKLTFVNNTKPRSSSAKSTTRNTARLRKPSPKPKDRSKTPLMCTDRSLPITRFRKPVKASPRSRLLALEKSESPEELTLSSADLYGPNVLSMRHVECSTDFRMLLPKETSGALASSTGGV